MTQPDSRRGRRAGGRLRAVAFAVAAVAALAGPAGAATTDGDPTARAEHDDARRAKLQTLLGELELSGTDTRRQTNLEGFRNLPPHALDAVRGIGMRLEEAGHVAATILESMLEPAFAMGERFVAAAAESCPPGVIGPFALQCIIAAGPPKELVCYDVSLRIPGSPGTRYTPYSAYRWGRDVSVGERIAMEVVMARDTDRLEAVLT